MTHIERRHSIVLGGPVERIFPLFTPLGEKLWIKEWDPEFLHPESGETRDGMVFRTGLGDEATLWIKEWDPEFLHPESGETRDGMVFRTGSGDEATLWTCVHFDPAAHRVRYVRVTPASRFGFVEVACRALPDGHTEATVGYQFTALNEAGERYLAGVTEEAFVRMIDGWKGMIERWMASDP